MFFDLFFFTFRPNFITLQLIFADAPLEAKVQSWKKNNL